MTDQPDPSAQPRTTGAALVDALSGATGSLASRPHLFFWWIAGMTLAYHWLGYDVVSGVFAWYGKTLPPVPSDLSYSDVAALIGLPTAAHMNYNRNPGATQQ